MRPVRFGLIARLFYGIKPRSAISASENFEVLQCQDGDRKYIALKMKMSETYYWAFEEGEAENLREALDESIAWRDE